MEMSDLAARNIQRGRDHAISNYNNYRLWAGLRDLTGFGINPCYVCCRCTIKTGRRTWRKCTKKEEEKVVWRCSNRKSVCKKCLKDRAKEVRGSIRKQPVEIKVEDFIDLGEANFWFLDLIDPFSGALFEIPEDFGEVGKTNGRIIADTFERLMYGDRFFFNHKAKNNAQGLEPVALKSVLRRTFSSVLCDTSPVQRSSMLTRLEFPESAFRLDSTVLKCGDILKKSSLDLEGIAREIVGSDSNTNTIECELDAECKNDFFDDDGNSESYVVCTSNRCQLVTGECLDDADCSGGTCKNNFCLFRKGDKTEFRKECEEKNNCP